MSGKNKIVSPMVYDEAKYRAEDDLRTLQRAHEIRSDPKRMKAAMEMADEKAEEMSEMMKREKKGLRY